MRFGSILAFAAAGFSALAAAYASPDGTTDAANPIHAPVAKTLLKAGERFTVEWLPTAGERVTLVLMKGTDAALLDTLEVIASGLPNTGAFIWVPSTELAGDDDYSIQIQSQDPDTKNFSAVFKIASNGPGIKGTTIVPSTTRTVAGASATISGVPTYTGADDATATGVDSASVSSFEGAGVSVIGGVSGFKSVAIAAVVGLMAGGMLVL
ncbi:hypothetical protein BZA05DRAFT_62777 [Tricharina praecox]|uniref:uncharacterized protein n=1 Tax=Tricharina praecox TaxID=43433 RepID=UPI0022210170|nr:uncharacterized protein BZA05DRAFT_62777 [Tricharina praecox]KAI5850758.1 hypothetical protein BZA05DRAFT_62777 [Tricharina praecox]